MLFPNLKSAFCLVGVIDYRINICLKASVLLDDISHTKSRILKYMNSFFSIIAPQSYPYKINIYKNSPFIVPFLIMHTKF